MATAASHRDANEFVKCVVVGDPGVGKTCLVCARACDTKYTLEQLVKTHVATVWAIDHYRNDREVLERSWREVDGVPISLRLWDTFGYHDKDRGFAYNRADVVLLCFSTVRPNSLRNVRRVWYPEIKRSIPSTPIVLVGTQVDLRYLYKDPEYLKMNKGLLYRDITDKDIVSPEQGREMAKEIGAPYYEASVLTHYGVHDVFDNVVRAAVCDRRKVRFWNTDLRKLRHPLMQRPMEFPKPKPPKVVVPSATFQDDLSRLLFHQSDCDAIFIVQGNCFQAHKIVLMVAASVFYELFTMDLSDVVISPASTASNGVSVKTSATDVSEGSVFEENGDDRQCLLLAGGNGEEVEPELPGATEPLPQAGLAGDGDFTQDDMDTLPPLPYKEVNMPAFHSVHLQRCEDPYHPGQSFLQTVVTVSTDISARAFEYVLQYLYTGRAREDYDILEEARRAAELMGLQNLLVMISSLQTNETYLNAEAENQFHRSRCSKLRELALEKKILTDIVFEVDDGTVSAHKPLLMARCDMMFAMFSSDFLEASAKLIPFPGVSKDTFRALQEYLYTDERPCMMGVDCMDLIEVANRLCLNRLIKLTEEFVVRELNKADEAGEDIMEDVISMLEPAQFLNANQLASYCLHYMGTHFKELTKHYTKFWKGLKLENQIFIDKNRCPPQWYHKEMEMFERARQVSVKRQPRQNFKRQRSSSGCLCFTRRSRVKIQRSMSDDQT